MLTAGYAFGVTYGLLRLINVVEGVRVPRPVELRGLDEAELGERAYNLIQAGRGWVTERLAPAPPPGTTTRREHAAPGCAAGLVR